MKEVVSFAVHYTTEQGRDALFIVLCAQCAHDAVVAATRELGGEIAHVDKVVPMDFVP